MWKRFRPCLVGSPLAMTRREAERAATGSRVRGRVVPRMVPLVPQMVPYRRRLSGRRRQRVALRDGISKAHMKNKGVPATPWKTGS